MNTWDHNAPWDIIISSNSYVIYEYCTNMTEDWTCVEWMQVVPYESLKIQNQNNAESNSYTAMYVLVILLLVWIVKGIFRWIFPTKWRN